MNEAQTNELEAALSQMHNASCAPKNAWTGGEPKTTALAVLLEIRDRMDAHREIAAANHAAFNPTEVVTQLMLEIETGRFFVSL